MTDEPRRIHVLPAVLAAILMVFALIYRHALVAWFTGAPQAGVAHVPIQAGPGSAAAAGDVAYYTCSMHPQVHADHPGPCPICGMPLIPVTHEEQQAGVITVDEGRRALLGIRTAKAVEAPLSLDVRAEGRLVVDETRVHDVTLKVAGYVTDLKVNSTGQRVRTGDVMFTMYSPELYAAEQEYLIARSNRTVLHPEAGSDANAGSGVGDALVVASATKLRLLGVSAEQLRAIVAAGAPIERLAVRAPASGVVMEKAIVQGDAVTAGQRVFRIADLDQIWVEAEVYEADLARITKGQPASITLAYLPGRTFEGTVAFVYPYLDPARRSGRVRVVLPNQGLELKPDMFATVAFTLPQGNRLQIPASAVVYTGPRRVVFVDLGEGRLVPKEVTIGARSGDSVEVLSGIAVGDLVVTSGNFLVAAESRVRSGGSLPEADDAGR